MSSLPVQSNLHLPLASHCKGQGAVASSSRSAGRPKVVTHFLLEEMEDPHVRASGCSPCMVEKPILESDLDSFLVRKIQDTLRPCAPHLLLCALASLLAISSATSKDSEISRPQATVTSFLMMKS